MTQYDAEPVWLRQILLVSVVKVIEYDLPKFPAKLDLMMRSAD